MNAQSAGTVEQEAPTSERSGKWWEYVTKYLIMDAGDNVPNATFSFTVAPGAARSVDTSDNAVMQVLPGVGTPTIADVTFSNSDATGSITEDKTSAFTNEKKVGIPTRADTNQRAGMMIVFLFGILIAGMYVLKKRKIIK